jgi:SAM-dependent methyltransferase
MSNKNKTDFQLIESFLSDSSSSQTNALSEALKILENKIENSCNVVVLDLGCGLGESYFEFKKRSKNVTWIGLDIENSPEVFTGIRTSGLPLVTYDGVAIPIADEEIDIVFSHQVFEHVENPVQLLSEVCRVLKRSGCFVGSTSHLEPYHSHSIANYTPYGFAALLQKAGFEIIQLKPGIDSLTLIGRRIFGVVNLSKIFNIFFKVESPLNFIIGLFAKTLKVCIKKTNYVKLVFCGHLVFIVEKCYENKNS